VGLEYHLAAYGILGYGLLCSATGADALALAQQYLPLTYTFTAMTHKPDGELDHLYFEPPDDLEPAVQRFVVERAMGATSRLLHDVIGDGFRLSAFRLRDQAWPKTLSVMPVYGATVEFGATANVLSFRHAYLEQPLPQANPVTVAMCRQMCGELIEQRRLQLGTAALVRQYLDRSPGDQSPTLGSIASLLNTSERTLKRWLHGEGTSFRDLQAASRQLKADKLAGRHALQHDGHRGDGGLQRPFDLLTGL